MPGPQIISASLKKGRTLSTNEVDEHLGINFSCVGLSLVKNSWLCNVTRHGKFADRKIFAKIFEECTL